MYSPQISDTIIQTINKWSSTKQRLIVGIDGIPGVGKSTIMESMKGNKDALLIHLDNFLTPIDKRTELIEREVSPEEFMHGLFDVDDLYQLIEAYKAGKDTLFNTLTYKSGKRQIEISYDLTKPVLVIEGTFMFHPDLFNHIWDKRIYLDGDEKEIKKRREARTKKMMGDNYISEDDPRSFFFLGLQSIKIYQEKYLPKEIADLVLTVT